MAARPILIAQISDLHITRPGARRAVHRASHRRTRYFPDRFNCCWRAAHGELDAATLSWLDKALGASTTRSALLFLHHPPFDTGIAYTDVVRLRNSDAFAAVLGRHPRVLLVAAGHVHRAAQTVFAGISASICQRASSRSPSHSNHAGRRFSESSLQPSIFAHGFPDRDSEASLLTSCR